MGLDFLISFKTNVKTDGNAFSDWEISKPILFTLSGLFYWPYHITPFLNSINSIVNFLSRFGGYYSTFFLFCWIYVAWGIYEIQ